MRLLLNGLVAAALQKVLDVVFAKADRAAAESNAVMSKFSGSVFSDGRKNSDLIFGPAIPSRVPMICSAVAELIFSCPAAFSSSLNTSTANHAVGWLPPHGFGGEGCSTSGGTLSGLSCGVGAAVDRPAGGRDASSGGL